MICWKHKWQVVEKKILPSPWEQKVYYIKKMSVNDIELYHNPIIVHSPVIVHYKCKKCGAEYMEVERI